MLKYCKLSQYKIKKILKNFAEDYSSTDASKLTKLSRNTTDRYYAIFRKVCLSIIQDKLKIYAGDGEYIGFIRGEYFEKEYFNIYKINEKIFICVKLSEKPNTTKRAIMDQDFNKYLSFFYKRFSKFYGIQGQGYYYQLFECILRYNYTEQELYNLLWNQLKAISRDKTHELLSTKY
jgi:hypothetical protein